MDVLFLVSVVVQSDLEEANLSLSKLPRVTHLSQWQLTPAQRCMFRRCRFLRLQKLQIRSYYDSRTRFPSKGDKGKQTSQCSDYSMNFVVVVVAMSGGVDSSVTAKLLADKVSSCQRDQIT